MEKEPTGREEEPSGLIYFKVYKNWGQIAFHPNPQLDLQFNRYCTSTVGNCSGRDVEKFERFGLAPPVVS